MACAVRDSISCAKFELVDRGVSLTFSRAEAAGVSGGTFLFGPSAQTDLTLQPEDHDQRWNAPRRIVLRLTAPW